MWLPFSTQRPPEPRMPRRRTTASVRLGVEALEDRTVPTAFSDVFVFGDSISETGNAFLLTGGVAAAPPYFQGRFSNGPVWTEVLADRLGLPAPAPSLAGGTNYAFGGAETGGGLSFFGTPNVGLQIQMALADHGGFAGDELIVVAAGSNDLARESPSPARIVRNLSDEISLLAAAGGRTFLVPNLPSPGQNPANRGTSKEVYFDTHTTVVNRLLDQRLPKLEEGLGISIVRFDMDGVVGAMLHSPADFGLTNVTEPACPGCGIGFPAPDAADTMVPNPDEYLWWDFVHMTRVAHAVIGEAAAEVLQGDCGMPTALTGPLGLDYGDTTGLNHNAARGWFLDPTPGEDSAFSTAWPRAKYGHVDLLEVPEDGVSRLLRRDPEGDGLTTEPRTGGIRQVPGSKATDAIFALFTADEGGIWTSGSDFGRE